MMTEKEVAKSAAEELRKLALKIESGKVRVIAVAADREATEVPSRFGFGGDKRITPFHTLKLYLEDKED